jgi:hypothetical protein
MHLPSQNYTVPSQGLAGQIMSFMHTASRKFSKAGKASVSYSIFRPFRASAAAMGDVDWPCP